MHGMCTLCARSCGPTTVAAAPHSRLAPAPSADRPPRLAGMVLIGVWNWYTSLQLVHCKRTLANDPSMWGLGDTQAGHADRQAAGWQAGHAGRQAGNQAG